MLKSIKNKFVQKSKLNVKVDIHSHLIPEIDDGCFDMKESLQLLREMQALGYEKLIITPHIMQKKYPNNSKIIRQALLELRSF